MEELVRHAPGILEEGEPVYSLPDITEYGVRAPFHFAVIGQTDSGKTYSIMRRWLGGEYLIGRVQVGGCKKSSYDIAYIVIMVMFH